MFRVGTVDKLSHAPITDIIAFFYCYLHNYLLQSQEGCYCINLLTTALQSA